MNIFTHHNDFEEYMVPGMGFEPMTFGFPWKRSN